MDFIKESKKRPKLTSELTTSKLTNKLPSEVKLLPSIAQLKPVKWNLNGILLFGFIIFLVFFLYNCKYGFFHVVDLEPYAFS